MTKILDPRVKPVDFIMGFMFRINGDNISIPQSRRTFVSEIVCPVDDHDFNFDYHRLFVYFAIEITILSSNRG